VNQAGPAAPIITPTRSEYKSPEKNRRAGRRRCDNRSKKPNNGHRPGAKTSRHCQPIRDKRPATRVSLPTLHTPLFPAHSPLPTPHYPLPTTHYPLPTTHYPLPTTHCPLPTTHCPLPTTHYPLPTAHYPLPTTHSPLPTTHYPLPTPLPRWSAVASRKTMRALVVVPCGAWDKNINRASVPNPNRSSARRN